MVNVVYCQVNMATCLTLGDQTLIALGLIIIVNTIILLTENTVAYTILVCASLFLGLLMYFPCCGKCIHNECHHHLQDHL